MDAKFEKLISQFMLFLAQVSPEFFNTVKQREERGKVQQASGNRANPWSRQIENKLTDVQSERQQELSTQWSRAGKPKRNPDNPTWGYSGYPKTGLRR